MEELPENKVKQLFIGCDHTSLSQKLNIVDMLRTKYRHINIIDMGCHNSKSCHYTDIAHDTCQQFLLAKNARVILLCGTGTGMSIVANRYKGVRCAYGHTISQVMMARQHNDVNALALGVQVLELSDMRGMVQAFLETEFSGKDYNGHMTRHSIRVSKIDNDFKYLNNKIEDVVLEEVESEMPFKSNAVRDVVHTDIFKPENKKKVRKLPTQKNEKLHPINLKVNMVPFEKRHLSIDSDSDNENGNLLYVKTLPSHLSNTDSLNVNYDEDEMFVKHNDEVNQVFTKTISTHDTTETEKKQRSNVSVITNFIKGKRKNEVETTTYFPSNGEPIRTVIHYDDGDVVSEVHDDNENVVDDDDNTSVHIEDYTETSRATELKHVPEEKVETETSQRSGTSVETETLNKSSANIVESVSEDRAKMVLQMEKNHMLDKLRELKKHEIEGTTTQPRMGGHDTLLHDSDVDETVANDGEHGTVDEYDGEIDVDEVVAEHDAKNTHVNQSTHLTGVDGKRLFQEHHMDRDVPFLRNKVTPQSGTRSFQNKSRDLTANKIESRSRDFTTNTTTISTNMSNHLEYPDTINTDNTLLPVMANYAQNCSEAAKLEEDIMRKIVELRERVRLIYRDLNAEMGTVFNLNDTAPESS